MDERHTKVVYKRCAAYRPKPPLHGLILSKSPIKNHAKLFGSGQIVEPNQTKLSSTKPNKDYNQYNSVVE